MVRQWIRLPGAVVHSSIPGTVQGQVEWGFGQTAGKLDHLVPVPPMAGTLEIDNL